MDLSIYIRRRLEKITLQTWPISSTQSVRNGPSVSFGTNFPWFGTFLEKKIIQFWWYIKLSWGHVRSPKKCGPNWFSRFGYRQAKNIYEYIPEWKYSWLQFSPLSPSRNVTTRNKRIIRKFWQCLWLKEHSFNVLWVMTLYLIIPDSQLYHLNLYMTNFCWYIDVARF